MSNNKGVMVKKGCIKFNAMHQEVTEIWTLNVVAH